MNLTRLLLPVTVCFAILFGVASAATPSVHSILPQGAQAGTEVEVTFPGERLADADAVIFYETGIEMAGPVTATDSEAKVRLRIHSDCPPGEHRMRLRTRTGISELRLFNVSPYPFVNLDSSIKNDTRESAVELKDASTTVRKAMTQPIEYYQIHRKKGQRLSVEVTAMRLGNVYIDNVFTIYDPDGKHLTEIDDSGAYVHDGFTSLVAAKTGNYIITIQSATYQQGEDLFYHLHVGDFLRPVFAYPAGGPTGTEQTITWLGDANGPVSVKLQMPEQAQEVVRVPAGAPSGLKLRASPFPNVLEQEPENNTRESATVGAELPLAFNGVLEAKDEDWFKFSARGGQTYYFEEVAGDMGSKVDTDIQIYDSKGKRLWAKADKFHEGNWNTAPRGDFKAPEDGDYYLRVFNEAGWGGEHQVYRIEATEKIPSIKADFAQAGYSQLGKMYAVPRGGALATTVRINQVDYNGPVKLEFTNLPPGVTAHYPSYSVATGEIPVVFQAGADAPTGHALIGVDPRPGETIDTPIQTSFNSRYHLVFFRNQFWSNIARANRIAVSVAEAAPFSLELVPYSAPVVQGGSAELQIVAKRKSGFTDKITVAIIGASPGMSHPDQVEIPANKDTATYPVSLDRNAEPGNWQLAMQGAYKEPDGGYVTTATRLQTINVVEPFVKVSMERITVTQGASVKVKCQIEHLKPFDGESVLELKNLPTYCEAKPVKFTSQSTQVEIELQTTDQAPLGLKKNVFCEATVYHRKQPIVHQVAEGGSVRVDAPANP